MLREKMSRGKQKGGKSIMIEGAGEGTQISCELVRSGRKTVALEVSRDGVVRLRIPYQYPEKMALEFLERKRPWLFQAVEKVNQHQKKRKEAQAACPEITEAEEQAYRRQAKAILTQKADVYAKKLGVTYEKLTVKDQKTRWGSCSAKGNLNFNWRIVLAPEPVTDYVVIHELAHRIHMNHSAAFYQTIEAIMPDYRRQEQWLKENGDSLRYGRQSSAISKS